jgi:hypothetical protein
VSAAQRYAFHFRSWYIRTRIDFSAQPLPEPLRGRRNLGAARTSDWPWTRFERASGEAYGRLGRWR